MSADIEIERFGLGRLERLDLRSFWGDQVPDLIPFDLRARKALKLTFREALRMGHNYIGTEHILLALLELEDGTGVLAGLGVDKAAAEANITAAVAAILAAHEQN